MYIASHMTRGHLPPRPRVMAAPALVPPLERAPWALSKPWTLSELSDGQVTRVATPFETRGPHRGTNGTKGFIDECPTELASAHFGPRSLRGENSGEPRHRFKPLLTELEPVLTAAQTGLSEAGGVLRNKLSFDIQYCFDEPSVPSGLRELSPSHRGR